MVYRIIDYHGEKMNNRVQLDFSEYNPEIQCSPTTPRYTEFADF